MGDALVIAEHIGGKLEDITFEMIATANGLGGGCIVGLIGGSDAMVGELGKASAVIRVDGPGLENFNPEAWNAAARALVEASGAQVVLIGHTSMGMDLAGHLSATMGLPLASSCSALSGGGSITATASVLAGKMLSQVDLGAGPCIAAMAAGAASADAGRGAGSPSVRSIPAPATPGQVRFVGLEEPEAADVDITAQDVLVAIGRGIGDQDGVETAQELADALDAAVAGSRPIVDAGWLPKSRQVGKSGLKVTPKVYLALGISGAPEHLEGIKGASTVIAVNTDPNAPIFRVAHYGLVADLYDVCEELTEMLD